VPYQGVMAEAPWSQRAGEVTMGGGGRGTAVKHSPLIFQRLIVFWFVSTRKRLVLPVRISSRLAAPSPWCTVTAPMGMRSNILSTAGATQGGRPRRSPQSWRVLAPYAGRPRRTVLRGPGGQQCPPRSPTPRSNIPLTGSTILQAAVRLPGGDAGEVLERGPQAGWTRKNDGS
jgi:hypothetical protein